MDVAIKKCAAEGAKDCKSSVTYYNQCVAFAVPSSGKGQGSLDTAVDAETVLEMQLVIVGIPEAESAPSSIPNAPCPSSGSIDKASDRSAEPIPLLCDQFRFSLRSPFDD